MATPDPSAPVPVSKLRSDALLDEYGDLMRMNGADAGAGRVIGDPARTRRIEALAVEIMRRMAW
jgi:hypothetical protein